MSRSLLAAGALAALFVSGACAPPQSESPRAQRIERCHYDVAVDGTRDLTLNVAARCRGGRLAGFRAAERRMLPYVADVVADGGRKLAPKTALFPIAAKTGAALSYRIDLGRAAERIADFDYAERVGASFVAPASSFLLVPEPLTDAPVTVRVTTEPGTDFVTGLRRQGDGYGLDAHEIPFGTYSFFGRFGRETLSFGQAELELVTLDGPLAVEPEVVSRWVSKSARGVADFYGRFPVRRAVVGIVPAPGRDRVLFGKVLPESSPAIVLRVGEQASERALYADWVLVHELFHLGFPSFRGEGKWLDEGLATYFEPIIRARAGWLDERDVWSEFVREMPSGLRAVETGLENTGDYRALYWGGAIVCLLSDVEARRASGGARGLEAGLRKVLEAGGEASQVWPLERAIELIDSAFERPILAERARAYGRLGSAVDLRELFSRLGVRPVRDGVALDDSAPLAAVRKAIVRGP